MALYLNPLIVYESKLKIRVKSPWAFFKILFMSAVIYKQRLLHENKIMQLLHNYKCYGVEQSRFRNPLQCFVKNMRL